MASVEPAAEDLIHRELEPIDAVYTWADGSDPAYRAQKARYMRLAAGSLSPLATGAQRARDNGELRFSLRSLETYVPWIRNIYIVTNDQLPKWLDTSHSRVIPVSLDKIFPNRSHLPSFNSCAIELNLHRIPQLSSSFLYLNDDFFVGRPVHRDDFITPAGGQYIYLENSRINPTHTDPSVHVQLWAHTEALARDRWNSRKWSYLPAHILRLYDKQAIERLESLYTEAWNETSASRFRAANNLDLGILYDRYLLHSEEQAGRGHEARVLQWSSADYWFISLSSPRLLLRYWHEFALAYRARPKFFCINDDMATRVTWPTRFWLYLFLAVYFPRRSSFEKVGR